jgi:hypothetical protein
MLVSVIPGASMSNSTMTIPLPSQSALGHAVLVQGVFFEEMLGS